MKNLKSKLNLLKELWDLLAEPNKDSEAIAAKLQQMGYRSKNSNVAFFKYFADFVQRQCFPMKREM